MRSALVQPPRMSRAPILGERAEWDEPARRVGKCRRRLQRTHRRQVQVAVLRRERLAGRWERAGEHAGRRPAADSHDEAPPPFKHLDALTDVLVPRDPGPGGKLVGHGARRRRDLEFPADGDALERGTDEHLQPAAELERAGVDPVHRHPR